MEIPHLLIPWYQAHARPLPWRLTTDPYPVWISEIILQQTRVAQGTAYYERFLTRFPTLQALASAPLDDVLKQWEGLGYYTRARNLHAAAIHIDTQLGGRFPSTAAALEALPGIGPYTARAIASLCFGERVAVLDGNVFRVLSRLYADAMPINSPKARAHFQQLADATLGQANPALFNQAMMDLGATICTPTSPACPTCPVLALCKAAQQGDPARFPVKHAKAERGLRYYEFYLVVDEAGALTFRQRGDKSYWKGLWEIPNTEVAAWAITPPHGKELFRLKHDFTHFQLHIRVNLLTSSEWQLAEGEVRFTLAQIRQLALSRAVQKILDQYKSWLAQPTTLF